MSRRGPGWLLVVSWLVVLATAGRTAAAEKLEAQRVRTALKKTVALLQLSAATYVEKRDCFSCHHQALPAVVVARARQAGFSVDAESARDQSEFTHAYYQGRQEQVRAGEGVPGGAYNAGYTLWSLSVDGWKPDAVTADIVKYLQTKHHRDGSWRIRTHRPPLEDSHFTATALSLKGLQLYAAKEFSEDVKERTGRALAWLLKSKPRTGEDRGFRLLGLAWAGAKRSDLKKHGRELRGRQRDDGGWAQLEEMTSDAYATGQTLYALKTAGVLKPSDKAYQRGCRFLLKTQLTDGSWLVKTRSKGFQKYFESKFPHGKSQFISICGTCWASLALLETLPKPTP